MLKTCIFLCQGGGKGKFFSNPPIGCSENGFREGDLLEGKSAYGYPPLPPPPCPRMTVSQAQIGRLPYCLAVVGGHLLPREKSDPIQQGQRLLGVEVRKQKKDFS